MKRPTRRPTRRLTQRLTRRLDRALLRLALREHRLVGLALLRIVIGVATVLYCLADYDRRQFLWGPDSFHSAEVASKALPEWGFSLFLVSHSQLWFELLFHLVILVSVAFAVFGGRALTVAQAVLMWSLHYRNQDVLEGGDNLAQILIIFLAFTVSNGYFAPGAKARRARLREQARPTVGTAVHNLAAYLVVFQTSVLYLMAGYWKVTGAVWQDGAAMYYISRISGFQMSDTYAQLMGSAFLGTAVCYFTVFTELAFPFAVLSSRAWIRKANTLAIEAMHLGIMAFMGLVCFGLLMIGADCACLRDEDYRAMYRRAVRFKERWSARPAPVAGSARPAAGAARVGEEQHAHA
ncbi:hypothetical protein CFP65_7353 [Kitasatospora sp. MMS16-BH015]|uniref:hypothetical protein n=1 Tax=Kitasatospora sp. MMS16-BH015 TaxID=2018025 RepID=UPI000CA1F65A|nr:hypothetical protein [Kitasatospora sp. MMS16-BH015]AUG81937.1 hypothetical protein CFP65_7353 [Kitasatospora sp. MMS16-BH015]